jgi:hypothetical protein
MDMDMENTDMNDETMEQTLIREMEDASFSCNVAKMRRDKSWLQYSKAIQQVDEAIGRKNAASAALKKFRARKAQEGQ